MPNSCGLPVDSLGERVGKVFVFYHFSTTWAFKTIGLLKSFHNIATSFKRFLDNYSHPKARPEQFGFSSLCTLSTAPINTTKLKRI